MSTSNAPWWIALVAWIGLCTYWHVCTIKELCDAPLVDSASTRGAGEPLYIADGEDLTLRSPGNLAFANSEAVPNLAPVQTELDSLASYLSSTPDRKLMILGYYSANETNSTAYPDLGIARAESIKQYLVGLGVQDSLITTSGQLMGGAGEPGSDSLYGGIEFKFVHTAPKGG
jgi:OmpA-OmpF porin, OOP family